VPGPLPGLPHTLEGPAAAAKGRQQAKKASAKSTVIQVQRSSRREPSSAERPFKTPRTAPSAPGSPSADLHHPASDEDDGGPAAMMVDAVHAEFGGGATGASA
jgi:hypothetical protein